LVIVSLVLAACAAWSPIETLECYQVSKELQSAAVQKEPTPSNEQPEYRAAEERQQPDKTESVAQPNVQFSPDESAPIIPMPVITDLENAENWFRENLDTQAHGGIYIRAHGDTTPQVHKLHIWTVDEEHVRAAMAEFPGPQVEIVLEQTTFSVAKSQWLAYQIMSVDKTRSYASAQLDEQSNYFRVILRENYNPMFRVWLYAMVDMRGLHDYVRIEEESFNVNF